jgi:hypothetical protein
VIDMLHLDEYLIAFALFVVLPLLTRPGSWRVLGRLATRVDDWAIARGKRTDDPDRDDEDLWLMYKRDKLSADLRRVERLLATDTWMSATRQLGNRLAYDQLIDELRRIPDVFPISFQPQALDSWDESQVERLWRAPAVNGYSAQSPTVEVLDIGWGHHKR